MTMKNNGLKSKVSLFLTIACTLTFAACGNTDKGTDSSNKMTSSESSTVSTSKTSSEATKIVSLKGPTTIGLLNMMDSTEKEKYEFNMVTEPAEAGTLVSTGKENIALIPANVAANLYNKTSGNIIVLNINTLGMLYLVQQGEPITSIADLKGKTIILTGKGATPDLTIQYLLKENGLSVEDVTLDYKSEATEVVAALAENSEAIGLLPEPFVTVATTKNPDLKVSMDLTEEWNKTQNNKDSTLITAVTVVNKEYLESNKEDVLNFMKQQKISSEEATSNLDKTSELAEKYDIIKENIAKKAIPKCNISYIEGEEMKTKLSGYYSVLFDLSPEFIGGKVPEDDFYFIN